METPKPPKGYRLAKYRETYKPGDNGLPALWWGPYSEAWIDNYVHHSDGRLGKRDWAETQLGSTDPYIFAIPKPRYSCELEPGDEV